MDFRETILSIMVPGLRIDWLIILDKNSFMRNKIFDYPNEGILKKGH